MKRTAQAWAFAAILLLPNYVDLTSSEGDARMRSPVPLTRIAMAHLADIAIVALLFALLVHIARRLRIWPAIRWGLMAVLPAMLFIRNLNVMPVAVPTAIVTALCLLWFVLLALLIFRYPSTAAKIGSAGSSILAGFAVFAMIMTVQLGRAALWRPGPQSFAAIIPAATADRPRLVWILFDELAYKPVFEERDSSLQLPNFDRLRNESTLYTDMTPIAYRTTRVVPSMLLGQPVTDVTYTAQNKYLVEIGGDSHWRPFDAHASLFGYARDHGLATSIVGWYIAYCPVFVGVADDCYWSNEDAQDRGPTSTHASFLANAMFPLRILIEQAVAPKAAWTDEAEWNAEGHIASVQNVTQHALETVADSNADVIYLHLPAPHPLSFWDRRTHNFATGGSYLDSLDFSDRLLGRILDQLAMQPRWAATTLIVQGDHSWRTAMWRPLPGWSTEDERISHGGAWDPRPLLMIHAPAQNTAGTVSASTSVMYVHDAVSDAMKQMSKRRP